MPPNDLKLNRAAHLRQELKWEFLGNRERQPTLAPARCNVMSVARDVSCGFRRRAAGRAAKPGPLPAAFLFGCFAGSFCWLRV